uniref:Rapunzel 4 n=1 Tax=Oryzias sinensis TaxID=183150 RepID=A0A8C7Y8A9_9TELE
MFTQRVETDLFAASALFFSFFVHHNPIFSVWLGGVRPISRDRNQGKTNSRKFGFLPQTSSGKDLHAKMNQQLKKIVSEKKDVVEDMMDVFEKGAEMVASIAGDLFPIFSVAAPLVQLALDNVESSEAAFMKDQFQKVRDRLDVVSEEIQRINEEIKKSRIDTEFFSVEENIRNQFRKYMEILNAKPQFTEVKKQNFLKHFSKSGGNKNLHSLYSVVVGDGFFGEPLLVTILNYEEKSRRPIEEYCARLKNLFCIGIIALLGHAAVDGFNEGEELLKEWAEKMTNVQEKINAVVEECIVSFPNQAKTDCERLVRDQEGLDNKQLADALIGILKKKYDWVGWSVRVYKSQSSILPTKKKFDCPTGKSRFQVTTSNEKLNIWVSYSASPEPLDKNLIQELIQSQKKPTVENVAENLFEKLPGDCMVHTVKSSKDLVCSWSFTDDLHYWEEHKNLHVCVHSA